MSSLDESIDATHEHEACVDCDIDNQTDGIEFDHICPESDDLFDNTCTDDLLDNNFTMIASIMTHPIVRSTFVAIFFIGFFFVFYLAVNWILTLAAEEENEIKQKRLKSTPPPNPSTSTTSSTIPQAPDGPHCACCLKPEPPPPPPPPPQFHSLKTIPISNMRRVQTSQILRSSVPARAPHPPQNRVSRVSAFGQELSWRAIAKLMFPKIFFL